MLVLAACFWQLTHGCTGLLLHSSVNLDYVDMPPMAIWAYESAKNLAPLTQQCPYSPGQ